MGNPKATSVPFRAEQRNLAKVKKEGKGTTEDFLLTFTFVLSCMHGWLHPHKIFFFKENLTTEFSKGVNSCHYSHSEEEWFPVGSGYSWSKKEEFLVDEFLFQDSLNP